MRRVRYRTPPDTPSTSMIPSEALIPLRLVVYIVFTITYRRPYNSRSQRGVTQLVRRGAAAEPGRRRPGVRRWAGARATCRAAVRHRRALRAPPACGAGAGQEARRGKAVQARPREDQLVVLAILERVRAGHQLGCAAARPSAVAFSTSRISRTVIAALRSPSEEPARHDQQLDLLLPSKMSRSWRRAPTSRSARLPHSRRGHQARRSGA